MCIMLLPNHKAPTPIIITTAAVTTTTTAIPAAIAMRNRTVAAATITITSGIMLEHA